MYLLLMIIVYPLLFIPFWKVQSECLSVCPEIICIIHLIRIKEIKYS